MDVMNTLRSGRRMITQQDGQTEARGRRDERADADAQRWSRQGNLSRRLAGAFFAGNGAIQQSDAGNTQPTRMILK